MESLFEEKETMSFRCDKLPIPKRIDIKHNRPVNVKLRLKTDNTLEEMLKCVIGLALAKPEELVLSCLNCDFFNEKTELCKKCDMRPPARIIAFGCPQHENINDEIPF